MKAEKMKQKTVKAKEVKNITSVPMYNSNGDSAGTFELDKKIFTGDVNKSVMYHALVMYNANQRQGNACTKTRGDVSGGGKKPFRQKGTGRARAGSTRSPLWRHGGTIFGPHPRDFSYAMPKKAMKVALASSINSKLQENKLLGLLGIELKEPKTRLFKKIIDSLKLNGKILFILDEVKDDVKRASQNIEGVDIKTYRDFNMMDVLKSDSVVVLKSALEKLPERFV